MVKENISYLKKMIGEGHPAYSVMSFMCDTIDAMRTELASSDLHDPERADFTILARQVVESLEKLDAVLDRAAGR